MGKSKAEELDGADMQGTFSEEELEELDGQFDPCEHERKLRCDACLSREWDKGRHDGFDAGFSWVITEIKKRSGTAFADGKDDTARILRDLAKSITELAEGNKIISAARKR